MCHLSRTPAIASTSHPSRSDSFGSSPNHLSTIKRGRLSLPGDIHMFRPASIIGRLVVADAGGERSARCPESPYRSSIGCGLVPSQWSFVSSRWSQPMNARRMIAAVQGFSRLIASPPPLPPEVARAFDPQSLSDSDIAASIAEAWRRNPSPCTNGCGRPATGRRARFCVHCLDGHAPLPCPAFLTAGYLWACSLELAARWVALATSSPDQAARWLRVMASSIHDAGRSRSPRQALCARAERTWARAARIPFHLRRSVTS